MSNCPICSNNDHRVTRNSQICTKGSQVPTRGPAWQAAEPLTVGLGAGESVPGCQVTTQALALIRVPGRLTRSPAPRGRGPVGSPALHCQRHRATGSETQARRQDPAPRAARSWDIPSRVTVSDSPGRVDDWVGPGLGLPGLFSHYAAVPDSDDSDVEPDGAGR
jgi:hypothetical protein